jgi:potassium efflux system protein
VMIKNLHGQELNLTTGQMVAATAAADAQQGQLPPPTPAIDPQ